MNRFSALLCVAVISGFAPSTFAALPVGAAPNASPQRHVAALECGAVQCGPPNGGLPGLRPARLSFGDTRCDGSEPEFAAAAGSERIAVSERNHPTLRRTYTWFTQGNDATPIPWVAHCEEQWTTQLETLRTIVTMPEVQTTHATVPVQASLSSAGVPSAIGASLALRDVALPTRSDGSTAIVHPRAVVTNVAWTATNGCVVNAMPGQVARAVLRVPARTALPCVSARIDWELRATREVTSGVATGRQETLHVITNLNGMACIESCALQTDGEATTVAPPADPPRMLATGGGAAALDLSPEHRIAAQFRSSDVSDLWLVLFVVAALVAVGWGLTRLPGERGESTPGSVGPLRT